MILDIAEVGICLGQFETWDMLVSAYFAALVCRQGFTCESSGNFAHVLEVRAEVLAMGARSYMDIVS